MAYEPIANGRVKSLCINGIPVNEIIFGPTGPRGDNHSREDHRLTKHDKDYIRTSSLERGDAIFNWRSWTGISTEEIASVEQDIHAHIPQGILQENITFSGIPNFSKLPPTTRLVFPHAEFQWHRRFYKQAILAVWSGNDPCRGVGEPLELLHERPGLMTRFVRAARGKRGVMGFVLSVGMVRVGSPVIVYPPVE